VLLASSAGTAAARPAQAERTPRPGDAVTLLIRAEDVRLAPAPQADGDWFAGAVSERSFLGATTRLYVKAEEDGRVVIADLAGAPPAWADIGAQVHFGWAAEDALAYSSGTAPSAGSPP
jgi:ABC-type Fe3+/spermidine/putrescine transport system ATPase subunit